MAKTIINFYYFIKNKYYSEILIVIKTNFKNYYCLLKNVGNSNINGPKNSIEIGLNA